MRGALLELDVQELLWIVPLVERLGRVEPFVALQAYQVCAEHLGHHLGDLRLAHTRMPLDEERFFEGHGQMDRGGDGGVGHVVGLFHHVLNLLDFFSFLFIGILFQQRQRGFGDAVALVRHQAELRGIRGVLQIEEARGIHQLMVKEQSKIQFLDGD